MHPIESFQGKIKALFMDIDDTLTDHGRLEPEAYSALWDLHRAGISLIPVTGRPAGWCEMIARVWPVTAVVGENGGFYFAHKGRKMHRYFTLSSRVMEENQKKLKTIENKILAAVPGCAVASDQFTRLMDLAIDFCEDVSPLESAQVQKIVGHFTDAGAQAKISSIHVNGWFGDYNKLSTVIELLKREFQFSEENAKTCCGFIGDSPNDEPMFEFFPNSFGVQNVLNFKSQIKHLPKFICQNPGGKGFAEAANQILKNR